MTNKKFYFKISEDGVVNGVIFLCINFTLQLLMEWMKMNKPELKDFYINAVISSKSEKSPGVLFLAPCAEIFLFGNMSVHTSNTCESKKIISGKDSSRSMYKEYQSFFLNTREKINSSKNQDNKTVADKMTWFVDTLEKFIIKLEDFLVENENIRSDLTRVIYPSRSGGMLEDLRENLIGKMKPWALPSSGKDDKDYVDLITDDKGMNVAKLNGAEKLYYHNGSNLVSWMPTGTQLQILTRKLNSLLGYTSNDLIAHSEYFFSYVLQTFMNVVFVNNPHLLEIDRKRIVRNYEILLKNINEKNTNQFESYERAADKKQKENELERPTKFIKFSLKQISKDTSLENLDLSTEENKEKYTVSIGGIASFLCNAKHPNQVLVEKWMENVLAMGDAFCGKNNVLYLPLYKILQRFISLDLFKFENDKDKIEFKQMLHFMVNLSGKFRFKKTQFNLSGTEVQEKCEFGAQITTEEKYRVSTEYNTDIPFDDFQKLTQEIIKFEEFEKTIGAKDYKFRDDDINIIIKYLLDGRYFDDDVIEKILKDKKFSNKFIEQAQKFNIIDKECCYRSAYEILVNDYFDLLDRYGRVVKKLLSHSNLIKYFNNDKHKNEILDLDANLILDLELFDKLDAKTINSFLADQNKKQKMIQVLKLVIDKVTEEKLNKLNFDNFDNDLLSTVVLSRVSDIDNDKIKKINFGKLTLDAQKLLFKKMADNDFRDFDFDIHWSQVNVEVFKSASIGEWRKFVFNKIPKYNHYNDQKDNKKIIDTFRKRQDILKSMPVNILSLFDTRKQFDEYNQYYTFFNFFDDCFAYWSVEQILTFGHCTETQLRGLKNKATKEKILLKESTFDIFLSLQGFLQKLDEENIRNNPQYNPWMPKEILFKFFQKHLLENKNNENNVNQCLKYVFSGNESNCVLAMIIMEEFILVDDKIMGKNDNGENLSEISKKIKSALNWENETQRKKIIKNSFSFMPKINELMRECDKIVRKSQDRFIILLDIYKSFLNKILLLYPNDIEKDDVKKIPVYFLDGGQLIKQFCKMYGDRVHIDCFSEIIDSVNNVESIELPTKEISRDMYMFKKANSIFKILDVVDSIKEIEDESFDLDRDDCISNFIGCTKRTALLICCGYPMDEPGNCIETHLNQYNQDGKFDYKYVDSVLYGMFKNLCDKKITIDKFIEQYDYKLDESQKKQLGKIIKSENNTDNFSSFEEFILPLIENDYKNMNFAAFVQRYDLLKNTIGVENVDKRMINIAYDFVEGKLSFEEFINKYYVFPKNKKGISENKIIDPKIDDYHIEALKDEESQNILTRVLIDNEDTKTVINQASEKTIENLYKNLLPKSKNMTNKKELKQMRDSVERYLNAVKQCKGNGMFCGDTTKLAKILFTEEESDAETKAGKFKTMINTYTQENKGNWEIFSEIYVLRHISVQNMQKYRKLQPKQQKILDLNAKAENLEDVVKVFYQKIDNIGSHIKVLNECYSRINYFLPDQFLLDVQEKVKTPAFVDNFKMLFHGLVEISEMYASDKAMEICKKYEHLIKDKDNSGNSIKNFFSSMVNYVHFIKDYIKLTKILGIKFGHKGEKKENLVEIKEEKIGIVAYDMFKHKIRENFNTKNNFTFLFVDCLDKLAEISKLTYQEYKDKKNKKIKEISENEYMKQQQTLKDIYNKYEGYGRRFFSPKDLEIMCQEQGEISDFKRDFNLAIDTLKNIGLLKTSKVFKSCVGSFEYEILKKYRDKTRLDSSISLQKFIELGYQKYFSDGQIYNFGIINTFDYEGNNIYTQKSVIKKLPKIISDESTKKLDQASKELFLHPDDKLDYIIASGNSGEICTNAMRKLFWHMDSRKLKTFVSDYSFKDFKDKSKINDNNIAKFGVHLQNVLIDAFGYSLSKFKSKKTDKKEKDNDIKEPIENVNEYNKMSVSQKFIFGECFFGGMFRSIYKINQFKQEKKKDEARYRNRGQKIYDEGYFDDKIYNIYIKKELDELINKIKSRVLSICKNPSAKPPMSKNKLALIQAMPNKKSFNASLEELIARAFLSAHIYAYSGHIDGNEHDESLLNLGNDVFDKIISMLSRSTEHDEFKNIDEVKEWVNESSLKYFIRGTFNFNEIPENELSSHQMELEQNDLIAKYNTRILNHILSKIGDKVSAFEVFEKIYLDDKNKVIYKFDFAELLDLLHEKAVTTAKSKEDFLILLKFLKKVEIPTIMPNATRDKFFDCLLEYAKSVNLLDKDGKFVDMEALRYWVEDVVLVFAVGKNTEYYLRKKIFMYMADNVGKNISVMDVINILKETDDNKPNSGLVSSLSSCCNEHFVNHLFGHKETQFISAEDNQNLDTDKLEDVFCFLEKIGRLHMSDLLNLFPMLDVMNEKEKLISIDNQSGAKKFINENSLQKFFGYKIIDDNKIKKDNEGYKTSRRSAIELLKFLYAISRIPKDKTLLDVVKQFPKSGRDKISANEFGYQPNVFESAVQAIYDCLSKEKDNINESNKPDYINFLIRFFTNIKIWAYLNKEIKQNVLETVGEIFNLFQSQELVEHISDIQAAFFGDKADGTSMLYSIFCKSIENMGNDDITNGNLLKVLEMLESLENICESDFNKLKNVLNEKIKTVMSENNDSQKMANDILSIVSGKKISSLLDLSPCFDILDSTNLSVSDNNPTQKFFGNLELLTNFIKNGVPTDNKDCNNKWIRFKYAMQRIPKNITVINALEEIKQNHVDIWNFNFPELPGNLYANDFCKDICSRIQTEVNSISQDNEKLFETVDVLIEFFKKITLLDKEKSKIKDCFTKNWDAIVKKKDTNEESFIAVSLIETLKNLLSKYKFNDVNDITTFFDHIKKILKELKLDSQKDTNIDIFIPTVLAALNNSNLNIFLLLEYLKKQYYAEIGDESSVCKRALQNKDILNKLSDMFKQKIEELEKEKIENVQFPYYFNHNYEKSGIVFLVYQFVVNNDINNFQSVVHSALRICCCNITDDKLHIKKCKIVGNGEKYNWDETQKELIVDVGLWIHYFFTIFSDLGSTAREPTGYHLGILQKMALEYLIDTLGKDIKIFDVLNNLIDKTKTLFTEVKIGANEKIDESTTLNREMSKILVDKILGESFPKWKNEVEDKDEEEKIKIFEADKKIRFASKFVQLVRFKIDATEEKRLFDELRKQKREQKLKYEEEEQKKLEELKKRQEKEKENKKLNENKNTDTEINESEKDINANMTNKKNKPEKGKENEEKQDDQNKTNTMGDKGNHKHDTIDSKQNENNKQQEKQIKTEKNKKTQNDQNEKNNNQENNPEIEKNMESNSGQNGQENANEKKTQTSQNKENTYDNKQNSQRNNEKNMTINTGYESIIYTNNKINVIDVTDQNNEKITGLTLPKQIENPINKKSILIKCAAWLLTLCFVSLCIYFFVQYAIANAFITLILTIIFVVVSILLTIYLPNKKEPNINTIKMPFNKENDMYNYHVKSTEQPEKQIIEKEKDNH